ncbi:MAG: hypothetical protein AB7G93_13580 [Bdellovibrionales bacterium]
MKSLNLTIILLSFGVGIGWDAYCDPTSRSNEIAECGAIAQKKITDSVAQLRVLSKGGRPSVAMLDLTK